MRRLNNYCSDEFRELFRRYGCSVRKNRTLEEYVSYVNLICGFLQMDFLEINTESAERYMRYMMSSYHDGKLSRKTICVRLSCYKSIGRYLEEVSSGYISPFEYIRRPDKSDDSINPKRIPTIEELDSFMSVVKNDPMYFAIYALATRVGLSASAILKLRDADVMRETYGEERDEVKMFLRLDGNGLSEDRYIILPKDVTEILEQYLAVREPTNDCFLFHNHHKRALTLKNLDSATERFVRACGIERYTMKDFRSRALLELMKTGADIDSIKEYTGLSYMRINTLARSKYLVDKKCPADLVNYELKTS